MPSQTNHTKPRSGIPPRSLLYALGLPAIFIPGLILAAQLGWDWPRDLARLELSGGLYQNQTIFPHQGTVVRVVDGDTLELGQGQTVRLLGVQAPERGRPLYEEAAKYLEKLALNQKIALEYETVDNMDKYGRLVAYLYVIPNSPNSPNSLNSPNPHTPAASLNVQILASGLAKFLYYPHYKKYKYFALLQKAQAEAQSQKLGLWSVTSP